MGDANATPNHAVHGDVHWQNNNGEHTTRNTP